MTAETAARETLCRTAHSLYQRGLTHGSTGNLSIRLDDGWLMSPTGASLGELDPVRRSRNPSCIWRCTGSGPAAARWCICIRPIR